MFKRWQSHHQGTHGFRVNPVTIPRIGALFHFRGALWVYAADEGKTARRQSSVVDVKTLVDITARY